MDYLNVGDWVSVDEWTEEKEEVSPPTPVKESNKPPRSNQNKLSSAQVTNSRNSEKLKNETNNRNTKSDVKSVQKSPIKKTSLPASSVPSVPSENNKVIPKVIKGVEKVVSKMPDPKSTSNKPEPPLASKKPDPKSTSKKPEPPLASKEPDPKLTVKKSILKVAAKKPTPKLPSKQSEPELPKKKPDPKPLKIPESKSSSLSTKKSDLKLSTKTPVSKSVRKEPDSVIPRKMPRKDESRPTSSTDPLKNESKPVNRQVTLLSASKVQHCDSSSDIKRSKGTPTSNMRDLHEECSCGINLSSDNLKNMKISFSNPCYDPFRKHPSKDVDVSNLKLTRRKDEGKMPLFTNTKVKVHGWPDCPIHEPIRIVTIVDSPHLQKDKPKADIKSSLPKSKKPDPDSTNKRISKTSVKRKSVPSSDRKFTKVSSRDDKVYYKHNSQSEPSWKKIKVSDEYHNTGSQVSSPIVEKSQWDKDFRILNKTAYSKSSRPNLLHIKTQEVCNTPQKPDVFEPDETLAWSSNAFRISDRHKQKDRSPYHRNKDPLPYENLSVKVDRDIRQSRYGSEEGEIVDDTSIDALSNIMPSNLMDQDLRNKKHTRIDPKHEKSWLQGQWCVGDEQPVTVVKNLRSRYSGSRYPQNM